MRGLVAGTVAVVSTLYHRLVLAHLYARMDAQGVSQWMNTMTLQPSSKVIEHDCTRIPYQRLLTYFALGA